MINTLCDLYNVCWNIGEIPNEWKTCNLTPIHKPRRDPTEFKNYRPIALLYCVGKLLCKIITKRLSYYLKEGKYINTDQSGFIAGHNTYECLSRITENIYDCFQKNSVCYAVFLDINKAYDSVWRNELRYKL